MLLLFATPLFAGFANAIMPLQIGSPDVAFPRLNMISYWLYLFGGLISVSGFLSPSGPPSFGWYAYVPLSNGVHSPGIGGVNDTKITSSRLGVSTSRLKLIGNCIGS